MGGDHVLIVGTRSHQRTPPVLPVINCLLQCLNKVIGLLSLAPHRRRPPPARHACVASVRAADPTHQTPARCWPPAASPLVYRETAPCFVHRCSARPGRPSSADTCPYHPCPPQGRPRPAATA